MTTQVAGFGRVAQQQEVPTRRGRSEQAGRGLDPQPGGHGVGVGPSHPRRQLLHALRDRSEHQGRPGGVEGVGSASQGALGLGHRRPERAEDAEVDPTAVEVQPLVVDLARQPLGDGRQVGSRSSGLTDRSEVGPDARNGSGRDHPRSVRRGDDVGQVLSRRGEPGGRGGARRPADAVRGSHGVVDGGLDVGPLRRGERDRAERADESERSHRQERDADSTSDASAAGPVRGHPDHAQSDRGERRGREGRGRPPQVQGGQSDQCGGCGAGDAAPAVLPRQGEAETQCDQPGHAPPAGGTDDDEAGGGGQAPATGPGPGDRAHHDQGDPPHDVEEIGAGRRRVRCQRGEGPCDDADGGDGDDLGSGGGTAHAPGPLRARRSRGGTDGHRTSVPQPPGAAVGYIPLAEELPGPLRAALRSSAAVDRGTNGHGPSSSNRCSSRPSPVQPHRSPRRAGA